MATMMESGQFRAAMEALDLKYEDVARINGSHHVTVRRWLQEGKGGPPNSAAIIMGLMLKRRLSPDELLNEAAEGVEWLEGQIEQHRQEIEKAKRELAQQAQEAAGQSPPE